MSVSTSVQVQIGNLLAHCTVEIVLDVPSSAILPREVTSFCSKVTAAVVHASNEARAEHAGSSTAPPEDGERQLREAQDLLEELQVAIEPLERKRETNNATAGETAGTLINSEPPAVDEGLMAFLARPQPQNAPGRAPLAHDEPQAHSHARRRSRHDSLEPGEVLPEPEPKRIRMKNSTSQAALMANNPTNGPYKKKNRKRNKGNNNKGTNPMGYWLRDHNTKKMDTENAQQGDRSARNHSDNVYPTPLIPAMSYLPAATAAASMAGAPQTAASYAPIPYGSTLFSYSAPTSYALPKSYSASDAYQVPATFSSAATAFSAPVVKTEPPT